MQVADLIKYIHQILPILEHYKDISVEEMLADIYGRCCCEQEASREGLISRAQAMEAAGVKPPADEKPAGPSFDEAIHTLPRLCNAERRELLDNYSVKDIKKLAKALGMKGYSKYNTRIALVDAFCAYLDEQPTIPAAVNVEPAAAPQELSFHSSEPQPSAVADNNNIPALPREIQDAARQLLDLPAQEREQFLEKFKLREIRQIAEYFQLKIPTKIRKSNAIIILTNHFSFIALHQEMKNRP